MRHTILIFFFSIAASFLLYGRTMTYDFVYDDKFYSERPALRDPRYLTTLWLEPFNPNNPGQGGWRPVSVASMAVNYLLFGESPTSFHVVNILLYGFVIFLVYTLARGLFSSTSISFFTASLFAVMPIHTEVVANIKSRDELLAMVCMLISWIFFQKGAHTGQGKERRWRFLFTSASVVMAGLGFLSKDTAIVIPFIFFWTWWVRSKPHWKIVLIQLLPFVFLYVVYVSTRSYVLGPYAFGRDTNYVVMNPLLTGGVATRLITSLVLVGRAVQLAFAPIGLSATHHYQHIVPVTHPFSLPVVRGLLIFLGLFWLAFLSKRRTTFGIGAAIFVISWSSVSKAFVQAGDIFSERAIFFPSLGLMFIMSYCFSYVAQYSKKVTYLMFYTLLLLYGMTTIERHPVWKNDDALFTSMIRDAPKSIVGYVGLASHRFNEKKFVEAKQLAKLGYDIYPEHPPLLNLIAKIAAVEHNLDAAVHYVKRSTDIYPATVSYLLLVQMLTKNKQYTESTALILDKLNGYVATDPDIRFLLAINSYRSGKREEAKKYFDWDKTLSEKEKIARIEAY